MSDIEKQANELFRQLVIIARDLGSEAEHHYNCMALAHYELDMMIWHDHLCKTAPELRLFKIVVSPGEETQQTFLVTVTFQELWEKLFELISTLTSGTANQSRSETQLRYSIRMAVSHLYQEKDTLESIELTACNPIKHIITLYPGIAERVEK